MMPNGGSELSHAVDSWRLMHEWIWDFRYIRMILSETHSGPLSNNSVIALESDALCRDVAFLVIMSVYSTLGPSDAYMRQ